MVESEDKDMKYVVVDGRRGDEYTTEWNTLEEALSDAEGQWYLLSDYDKKHTDYFYVLESANPDEEAENHLDGNPIKVYVEDGKILKYVIIDDRLLDGDEEKESKEMYLDDVRRFFSDNEDIQKAYTVSDINDALRTESCGDAYYRVEEV